MAVPPYDLSSAVSLALEAEDPAIEALSALDRKCVGAVWLHRAESEMTAAVGFIDLATDLFALKAAPNVRWLAMRAATDEIRHSEICRRVASRYLAEEQTLPEPRAFIPARFGDCPDSLNRTLRVVLQSCISETIGSAALKACLDIAAGPVARAALRALLRDEIEHARIGYAHLASGYVDPGCVEHVRRALPTLIELTRRAWYAEDDGMPASVPSGHGCLDRNGLRAVVEDALGTLVYPGLAAVGVGDAEPAKFG